MEQTMYQAYERNCALLRGRMLTEPVYSHENHGKRFETFMLAVERLSGTIDTLRVVGEEHLTEGLHGMVEIEGQIRSYSNRSGQGSRLMICVFASSIRKTEGEPENDVFLQGTVCREPVYRRTPLGREICDVMLTVQRKYGRRDLLPCILWGSLARMAAECSVGTELWIRGRLQSRTYQKQLEEGSEERTAYEISAITAGFSED